MFWLCTVLSLSHMLGHVTSYSANGQLYTIKINKDFLMRYVCMKNILFISEEMVSLRVCTSIHISHDKISKFELLTVTVGRSFGRSYMLLPEHLFIFKTGQNIILRWLSTRSNILGLKYNAALLQGYRAFPNTPTSSSVSSDTVKALVLTFLYEIHKY